MVATVMIHIMSLIYQAEYNSCVQALSQETDIHANLTISVLKAGTLRALSVENPSPFWNNTEVVNVRDASQHHVTTTARVNFLYKPPEAYKHNLQASISF